MISIDAGQHDLAPGYMELPFALFDALATIHKGNADAEGVRAGAEYVLDGYYRPNVRVNDCTVWHVFVDTPRGDFRYIVTDEGALLAVERFEPHDEHPDEGEWFSLDLMTGIDPYTWKVQA